MVKIPPQSGLEGLTLVVIEGNPSLTEIPLFVPPLCVPPLFGTGSPLFVLSFTVTHPPKKTIRIIKKINFMPNLMFNPYLKVRIVILKPDQ